VCTYEKEEGGLQPIISSSSSVEKEEEKKGVRNSRFLSPN
jgi:hypothetical protein